MSPIPGCKCFLEESSEVSGQVQHVGQLLSELPPILGRDDHVGHDQVGNAPFLLPGATGPAGLVGAPNPAEGGHSDFDAEKPRIRPGSWVLPFSATIPTEPPFWQCPWGRRRWGPAGPPGMPEAVRLLGEGFAGTVFEECAVVDVELADEAAKGGGAVPPGLLGFLTFG